MPRPLMPRPLTPQVRPPVRVGDTPTGKHRPQRTRAQVASPSFSSGDERSTRHSDVINKCVTSHPAIYAFTVSSSLNAVFCVVCSIDYRSSLPVSSIMLLVYAAGSGSVILKNIGGSLLDSRACELHVLAYVWSNPTIWTPSWYLFFHILMGFLHVIPCILKGNLCRVLNEILHSLIS